MKYTCEYHEYWMESDSAQAVAVRNKIQDWMDKGASRNYPTDAAYMQCPTVCAKAVRELGYKWEQTL